MEQIHFKCQVMTLVMGTRRWQWLSPCSSFIEVWLRWHHAGGAASTGGAVWVSQMMMCYPLSELPGFCQLLMKPHAN